MIKDIYSDPDLYDAAHWWKTNDIEFIASAAAEFGGPVLEMASGTGRLASPILEKGINYTGIELSSSFVKYWKAIFEILTLINNFSSFLSVSIPFFIY